MTIYGKIAISISLAIYMLAHTSASDCANKADIKQHLQDRVAQALEKQNFRDAARAQRALLSNLEQNQGSAEDYSKCLIVMAHILASLKKYDEAEKNCNDAIAISSSQKRNALLQLASIYQLSGNFEHSEKIYLTLCDTDRQSASAQDSSYATDLLKLGDLYSKEGKNMQAKLSFKELLEIQRKFGNETFVAFALNKLGKTEWMLGEVDSAEERYLECARICNKITGDHLAERSKTESLNSLRQIYIERRGENCDRIRDLFTSCHLSIPPIGN